MKIGAVRTEDEIVANPEHVRILKLGVGAWNQWRSENPGIQPNLQGQSFKGQDLSGANLSEADIRSTNFTEARLRGTNFSDATAGLQRHWTIFWVLVAWVLAVAAGMTSAFAGYAILLIFGSNLGDLVAGWFALMILAGFFIVMVRKGTVTGAFVGAFAGASSVAIAGAVAFAVAFAFPISDAFAIAGTVAGIIAFAFAGAVAIAVIVAFATAVAGTVSGAIAGIAVVAGGLIVAVIGTFAVAGAFIVAIAGVLLSAYIGWRALQEDPREAWIRSITIAFATIGGTSFRDADLTQANFFRCTLNSTDLRRARLMQTNWHRAQHLDCARAGGTPLFNAKIRNLAVTHRGVGQSYQGCDLKGLHLAGADLSEADLSEADLSHATLEGAWLEQANLTKTQTLGTNFQQARLTGACLEAWNIDSTTQLENTICKYVYLLNGQQERRPSSGTFAPGEFARLFEEVLDTIDLIFRNGLDWRAFAASFQQVQVENEGTELNIQSIENKGDGVVVVRVQAPPHADKEKIHRDFSQSYEAEFAALKAQYQAQLQAKDEQIAIYREKSTDMKEIVGWLANRPINVETKIDHQSMPENPTSQQIFQIFVGNVDDENTQRAAIEIQQLLKQLEASNPNATESEQQAFVNLGISPTLKERLANALQAGWEEAIEQFIESKYIRVAIALLAGWQSDDPKS